MRSYLVLATALVTFVYAQVVKEQLGTSFKLPDGLPNNAILTFYFWHNGEGSVSVNLYNSKFADHTTDFAAHLRLECGGFNPVASSSKVHGKWLAEARPDLYLDADPPAKGWWRVDVIKLDDTSMNVFFQGFWAGIRTFEVPLDKLRSVYVVSEFVDHKYVEISLKTPNGNVALPNAELFQKLAKNEVPGDRQLITLSGFPLGSHIDIVTVLRDSKYRGPPPAEVKPPALGFVELGGTSFFMKIARVWESMGGNWPYAHNIFIAGSEWEKQGTLCSNMRNTPNGALQHIRLERIYHNVVRMRILYKGENSTGIVCEHPLPIDKSYLMDQPFHIMGRNGAVLYHIEYSSQIIKHN